MCSPLRLTPADRPTLLPPFYSRRNRGFRGVMEDVGGDPTQLLFQNLPELAPTLSTPKALARTQTLKTGGPRPSTPQSSVPCDPEPLSRLRAELLESFSWFPERLPASQPPVSVPGTRDLGLREPGPAVGRHDAAPGPRELSQPARARAAATAAPEPLQQITSFNALWQRSNLHVVQW